MHRLGQPDLEAVHDELWRRFVDQQGILLDFTELEGGAIVPTPEECKLGIPNANGWWTPTENGAMFNGLYLDGMINRALSTGAASDRAKVERLVSGLLLLASCSNVSGFVGRGFATDRKTTWPLGSTDQTSPWFYGLWKFLQSGLGDAALRHKTKAKMVEVADALVANEWNIPSQVPYGSRGSVVQLDWEHAPRLLFIYRAMYQVTGDTAWESRYLAALHETRDHGRTRVQICRQGMIFEKMGVPLTHRATWTGSAAAVCLRGLWEMETDERLKSAYGDGLRMTAGMAAGGLRYRLRYSQDDHSYFEGDWRKLNPSWRPQKSVAEARVLAMEQMIIMNKMSPRRKIELAYAREAIFAAWVITLCPDGDVVERYKSEILETISHFNPKGMHFVSFFPMENAWWRLMTTH
jgi:hypothetical protein